MFYFIYFLLRFNNIIVNQNDQEREKKNKNISTRHLNVKQKGILLKHE